MKPRGPTEGSGPVVWAVSGWECWDVKAQFSGTLGKIRCGFGIYICGGCEQAGGV